MLNLCISDAVAEPKLTWREAATFRFLFMLGYRICRKKILTITADTRKLRMKVKNIIYA